MSLAEYYRTAPIPKSCSVSDRRKKDADADKRERQCRENVNARDGHRCFFPGCRTRASDKHHVRPRSLMGEWVTKNILSACRLHHDYFKAGWIRVTGNPDRKNVVVHRTELGRAQGIHVPNTKETTG